MDDINFEIALFIMTYWTKITMSRLI